MTTTFSYDIGIASIGSAIEKDNKLVYMGTRVFNEAISAKEARLNRSSRRTTRRKTWRKNQMKNAFIDFRVIEEKDLKMPGFMSFTTDNEYFKRPIDNSVYHLRKRALSEKVTKRELLLALYNICGTRGHFLLETIDFSKGGISFEMYKDRFYQLTDSYVDFVQDTNEFDKILRKLFDGDLNDREIKNTISKNRFTIDEESETILIVFLRMLCNYKVKPQRISEKLDEFSTPVKIDDLKKQDELSSFYEEVIELYDLSNVARILKNYNYLCELAVDNMDEYRKSQQEGEEAYESIKESIKSKAANNASHSRSVKNLANSFPNGLYVKEASDILRKQQEYYPEITDRFIEVCTSIISARIPYYIGPLDENAKNAWVVKNQNFKYSYEDTMKQSNNKAVNEAESIKKWKLNMISRCTYLHDKCALPKGSFIAETFSILNELNILSAEDKNGNDYYLTRDDKIKVFDSLFLKNKIIKFSDICDVLDIGYYGPSNKSNKITKFNNSYSVYLDIIKIDQKFCFNSIVEIFTNKVKVEKLENLILDINLYNEEKSKLDVLINEHNYSMNDSKKLSRINSNGFFAFSKEIIMDETMNEKGETMLDILFSDNVSTYKNEQMTIIYNATDLNGVKREYFSNKYFKKLEKNDGKLTIDLLIEDGKPFIPISRPTIRALNECMKLYEAMIDAFGVPDKVVIETARDLKDSSREGLRPEKFRDTAKKLYEYVQSKSKEKKIKFNLEQWKDIDDYVEKNKLKIDLYIRQNGIDLLTGKRININNLSNYEVDHILPRGFGDDSKDDKMLVSKLSNSRKGDRLPLMYIEDPNTPQGETVSSSQFIRTVKELFELELISEEKRNRLLLDSYPALTEFVNRNLVDTRYIIREFMAILNAYSKYNNYNSNIVGIKSAYTNLYRKAFSLKKNRDFGVQHHAHDAALLIVAEKTLSKYYPDYGKGKIKPELYFSFVNKIKGENSDEENKKFIRIMYERTFNEKWYEHDSFIGQIKHQVPFYSIKVEKNWKGKFFDATIYKQEKRNENSVLSILGVNNDKRVFSSVECVAVDFYKSVNDKGKRQHIAIHIPKFIVNPDGQINKELYKKLILGHYGAKELLKNGEINEKFYRFRAFKNDLIFDTQTNCPFIFNIGSIANKKTELKFVNIFSYNDIYDNSNYIKEKIEKRFNLRNKLNPNGVDYINLQINQVMEFVKNDKILIFDDKHKKTILEMLSKCKNVYELSESIALFCIILNRPFTPPVIFGQVLPTANNNLISKNLDAEYVKIKSNILGVRFTNNNKGKLIIQSPKEKRGAYKMIKREKFSWKIGKVDV